MNPAVRRWAVRLLRYGLCLAAVAYLAWTVPWHDQVRLAGPQGRRVRLLEQRGPELVIEADGQRQTVPRDSVHQVLIGEQHVPDIEPGIPSVIRQLNRRWALLSILLFAPVWFIQAYRLVLMVAIQNVHISYWNAVKLTFAGNFFNFALPGTTGGDLVKAYYLTHYTHLKTEVVTTVFLDRAIGLFGILLLAATGIAITWNPAQFSYLASVLGLIVVALFAGALVIFSRRLRHALRLSELAARLPGGNQLLRIGRATVALRQHKLKVGGALAATLILQAIVMVSAAVMAWALGMKGSLTYYFIYVSIGFLIAAIPILPPQAIGVMEYAYVQFFTQDGLNSASQALALAVGVRLIQLIWAVPGVLVPLLGAHLPSATDLQHLETTMPPDEVARPSESPSSADPLVTPLTKE